MNVSQATANAAQRVAQAADAGRAAYVPQSAAVFPNNKAPYSPLPGTRLSSSILFLRDGPQGLEVLMLKRPDVGNDPARSGVAVFPGGGVDAADMLAAPLATGLDDAAASARLGLSQGGLAFHLAAVRESFEEVGVLLVNEPFDATALQRFRNPLNDGELSLAQFCQDHGFTVPLDGLHYLGHWLTPPGAPKRFDTRFFAARMPQGQTAVGDEREAESLMWLTPAQALSPETALKLLPVTRVTLQDLVRFATTEQALADIAARPHIPLLMPRRVMGQNGVKGATVVLPHEWAYAEVGKLDPQGRADVQTTITPGRAVVLSPHIIRVTAPNAGPMTGPGTNTYLVGAVGGVTGQGTAWTVIDPGPAIAEHVQTLISTVTAQGPGAHIARILVTHTHRDHSPGAAPLAAATGAPVWGQRTPNPEWQDTSFAPARQLLGGEVISIPGQNGLSIELQVLHTPGHASNHLCYLLAQERTLFTGDHVMQGSTVVINPPDGDMAAYLRSLGELEQMELEWLAPGHGFLVADPPTVLRALIAHRLKRESKVLKSLQTLEASLAAGQLGQGVPMDVLVQSVYDDVSPNLHGLALRSLLAHLLKLEGEAVVRAVGQGHARWSCVNA